MFHLGFNLIFLAALIRALVITEMPFLCAGIFAVAGTLGRMCMHGPSWQAPAAGIIAFGICSLYFWLLDRFSESMLWWLILIIGFPFAAVLL